MRVVDVWPEFGLHGKDKVTLRHVLLHTAGYSPARPCTTRRDSAEWGMGVSVLPAACAFHAGADGGEPEKQDDHPEGQPQ